MAFKDRVNPVTGKLYSEEYGSASLLQPSTWNPTSFTQRPENTQLNNVKKDVAYGSNFMPYQNRLDELLRDPSKVNQTAGYQFALDQGNQAINRSAAAKGMLNSGNVLAELAKYGQGMASQQYNTETNRLADLLHGAQQFGLSSGYYTPPPPPDQFVGNAFIQQKPTARWY